MNDTTIICGDEISETCILKAGLLTFRMYRTPRSALHASIQPYWDIAHQDWQELWREEHDDGFQCGYFVPTGAECGPDGCPPVLVFRGSDGEGGPHGDFDNLGICLRGRFDPFVNVPPGGGGDVDPDPFEFDYTFSPDPDIAGKTMAEMRAAPGLTEAQLFSGDRGQETFVIDVPNWPWDVDFELDWRLDASLFYGTRGDWTVDFAQGLGTETSQYRSARLFAEQAARQAKNEHGGRLIITGHSLGGGLATCAGIRIRAMSEFDDLKVHVRGYNPAGLHENTAQRAGGTKSMANEVPTRLEHVKDELLNSLQAQIVPILNPLLKLGNQEMPPPVPTPASVPGISPGAMILASLSMEYAPYGQPLPVLFPLSQAAAFAGSTLPNMQAISAHLDRATSVRNFVQNFIDHLLRGLGGGTPMNSNQLRELSAIQDSFALPDSFMADALEAFTNGGPTPRLELGNTTYLNTVAEPFVNDLLQETVGFARILLASGLYHTFPPCATTLIMPRLPLTSGP
ncbi:MAG: hypothetical protein AAF601_10210 [Pseudomonadota bacterium]